MGRWNLASLMAVAVSKRPSPNEAATPRKKEKTKEGRGGAARIMKETPVVPARWAPARQWTMTLWPPASASAIQPWQPSSKNLRTPSGASMPSCCHQWDTGKRR